MTAGLPPRAAAVLVPDPHPLAALLDGLLGAVCLVDARQRRIAAANAEAQRLLGRSGAELLGQPVETLLRTPEDALFWLEAAGDRTARLDSETPVAHADGRMLWVRRRISFVESQGCWLLALQDLSGQREAEQARESLAAELQATLKRREDRHASDDPLTTLPGRAALNGRIELAVASARREGRSFALLNIDLDRFKQINDTLGHGYGDRVLKEVAERLRVCAGEHDALARLGGDQYALLLDGADARAAEQVALRAQAELARPFGFEALHFTVTCSIGIALFPRDGGSAGELLASAEQAMHWVKESGRSAVRFHQPRRGGRDGDLLALMRLDHDMRQALTDGRFELRYQPQVSLGDGQVIGAEALIRWRDPLRGEIAPGRFIPVAEESGFIIAIGEWVLRRAVEQASAWWRAGRRMPVAVNVSALQFQQAGFVELVDRTLAEARLPPELLELELTESILLRDVEEGLRRLEQLAALGVGMSIDDFGTGYSSLAYLKRFPIQRLKIDRSFVQGLPEDGSDAGIVNAIVQMGSALKLNVIAEGVETEAQREFLRAAGCDEFQGWLFARPLDAAAFEARVWGR